LNAELDFKMMVFRHVALGATLAAYVLAWPGISPADTPIPRTVTPTQTVPLLAAPPSGLFNRAGPEITTLTPGETYDVQSIHRRQDGIGSVATWIEVTPHTAEDAATAPSGWVFFGTTKSPEQQLFAPADTGTLPSPGPQLNQN
jgi:hypothetical protein